MSTPLTRRTLLAAPFTASLAAAKSGRKPNVIMFMTDDHGAWATGAYGCAEMHTPNIDSLAAKGVRFTRAFACTPVCSPSRMTYMTGKLPSAHGVQDYLVVQDSFGPTTVRFLDGHTTYAEILAKNGYRLGMCGKWHMGDDDKAQRGFTYWHTIPGGGGAYQDPEFVTNGKRRKLSGFKTDLVTDGALEFIEQSRNSPFYLLVPFYAPHTPFDYQPDEYRKHFEGSKFSCFPDEPQHSAQNPGLASHHGNRKSMRAYSALIAGVDHNIGRILKKLEDLHLREDTLIVFTADQGWNAGHHGVWGKGNGTIPFNMYEQSLRVPLIWNHPGKIRGGQTIDAMVSSYDYFPTILDYLGIPPHRDSKMVGRSYAAFVNGKKPKWRNRLYFEYSYVRGLRTETLKYVERTKEWPSELYDLEADPGEKRNVIADPAYQKLLASLRAELGDVFAKNGAPPIENWRDTTKQHLYEYRPKTQ
ncbi:MAG: sulfatase-like hydrolase/transferase [Bryobacteraceae bacterium]